MILYGLELRGRSPIWWAECHGASYITHFYCLAVEAGFYIDVVECLPVDPASWVGLPAGAGKIFLLYDNEKKKRVNDSQIVRLKENLKLSYGGPSQRQASGTNQHIQVLRQGRH